MANWRDHIRAVRAQVHQTMCVRAAYFLRADGPGRTIHVRLRRKLRDAYVNEGAVGLPRMHDADQRLLFDRAEVPNPMTNALVVLEPDEGYRLRAADVPYLGYVEVDVTPMTDSETAALWANRPLDFDDLPRQPRNVTAPSIVSDALPVLTGLPGDWTGRPEPDFKTLWLVEGEPVPGSEDSLSLDVTGLPGGTEVRFHVEATNEAGLTIAVSAPFAVPVGGP